MRPVLVLMIDQSKQVLTRSRKVQSISSANGLCCRVSHNAISSVIECIENYFKSASMCSWTTSFRWSIVGFMWNEHTTLISIARNETVRSELTNKFHRFVDASYASQRKIDNDKMDRFSKTCDQKTRFKGLFARSFRLAEMAHVSRTKKEYNILRKNGSGCFIWILLYVCLSIVLYIDINTSNLSSKTIIASAKINRSQLKKYHYSAIVSCLSMLTVGQSTMIALSFEQVKLFLNY